MFKSDLNYLEIALKYSYPSVYVFLKLKCFRKSFPVILTKKGMLPFDLENISR